MPTCWRCGGGKTIAVTTTGTHVLTCPTCGGSGQLPEPQPEQPTPAIVTRAAYPHDGMATDHPRGEAGLVSRFLATLRIACGREANG
jgi:hypothetical protein